MERLLPLWSAPGLLGNGLHPFSLRICLKAIKSSGGDFDKVPNHKKLSNSGQINVGPFSEMTVSGNPCFRNDGGEW